MISTKCLMIPVCIWNVNGQSLWDSLSVNVLPNLNPCTSQLDYMDKQSSVVLLETNSDCREDIQRFNLSDLPRFLLQEAALHHQLF